MQLFIELLLGKVERLEHLLVIDRQQRSVAENDHVLDEVRLTVQPTGGTRMLWTARIDRVTHLPLTLRVELADASGLAEPALATERLGRRVFSGLYVAALTFGGAYLLGGEEKLLGALFLVVGVLVWAGHAFLDWRRGATRL